MVGVRTLIACSALAIGCGRYIPPLPPEQLAPAAVENLVVVPETAGIQFAWSTAEKDLRGKELKSADGFLIERKEIAHRGDETNPEVQFEELGFVKDRHIEERDRLREEARAAGKVGRTVKSPVELTKFTFRDSTPQLGRTYIYQIVPTNQGGVKGQVGQFVRVVFRGTESVVLVTAAEDTTDLPTDSLTDEQGSKQPS